MAVTSPIAFELLTTESILQSAFKAARAFAFESEFSTHLAIATVDATKVAEFDCEILLCEPNDPASFAAAIKRAAPCDLLAIQDSQRPLTRTTQFHRALAELTADIAAVRPTSVFTETLKAIKPDTSIDRTIERRSMLQIATPEVIRFSAIDFAGTNSTWFVPLKSNTKSATIVADPESLRVNSIAQISLVQALAQLN